MKKVLLAVGGLFLAACSEATPTAPTVLEPSLAVATAPGHNKILCFDGESEGTIYGGECSLNSNGAKGTATLDNTDGDTDGSYSGVYFETTGIAGEPLADITQLSFKYSGEATAGSPRITMYLDADGVGGTNWTPVFISAYYCNDGFGLVDVINDPSCTIYYGADSFENWSALLAEYPDAIVADEDYPIFIVADDPGMWTVWNVKFGKAGK